MFEELTECLCDYLNYGDDVSLNYLDNELTNLDNSQIDLLNVVLRVIEEIVEDEDKLIRARRVRKLFKASQV